MVNQSGTIIERLHAAGLLPPNCGDITISDNYNNDPIGLRISFHCLMTQEMLEAMATPAPHELERE